MSSVNEQGNGCHNAAAKAINGALVLSSTQAQSNSGRWSQKIVIFRLIIVSTPWIV